MNADTNKMGGRKNDTTNEYPEYFFIFGMDDCLADSTRDSSSFFESPLTSGMSVVSTSINGIVMAVETQIRRCSMPLTKDPFQDEHLLRRYRPIWWPPQPVPIHPFIHSSIRSSLIDLVSEFCEVEPLLGEPPCTRAFHNITFLFRFANYFEEPKLTTRPPT